VFVILTFRCRAERRPVDLGFVEPLEANRAALNPWGGTTGRARPFDRWM